MHALMTERGYGPARATGTQVAELAGRADADLLDIPVKWPLFVETRLVTTADGAPMEYTESRYAGTRFVFHIEWAAPTEPDVGSGRVEPERGSRRSAGVSRRGGTRRARSVMQQSA